MSDKTVVLLGFEDQPNLGIGYLASTLGEHGFDAQVLDVQLGKRAILEQVQKVDPLIVGLSVIYQYYTPQFAELVTFLRNHDVTCMICAGGHYPSLRHEEVLEAMTGLDCVVRFEGEHTLLELARRLRQGRDWHDIQSIAYLANGRTVTTPLRPLIEDLDSLPFPYRRGVSYPCVGIRSTSMLASRGCPRDCSFCSIHRFYSIPPGRVRRTRSPENVVQEMLQLYQDQNIQIFLFQDDDFSLMSKRDRQWALEFVDCLHQADLADSIMWKMNCRADEVEPELFARFRSAGLFMVYLGLESGNETGLKLMNKHLTVEQNRRSVEVLKELGLRYEFGFMLFDPSSTIDLVLENIRFLREICGDGSATASFGKMLPYAGTDIEDQLRAEGRLMGETLRPDYSFGDRRTDAWFDYLGQTFHSWVFGLQSLQAQARWSQFELDVLERFHAGVPGLGRHRERITFLIHWYNKIFFRIVEDSAEYFRSTHTPNRQALNAIWQAAETQRCWLEDQIAVQRKEFFTRTGFPPELIVGENQVDD
jgi:anaerobic magnesium-protoporphyrin IX monomethyl ester cyclase